MLHGIALISFLLPLFSKALPLGDDWNDPSFDRFYPFASEDDQLQSSDSPPLNDNHVTLDKQSSDRAIISIPELPRPHSILTEPTVLPSTEFSITGSFTPVITSASTINSDFSAASSTIIDVSITTTGSTSPSSSSPDSTISSSPTSISSNPPLRTTTVPFTTSTTTSTASATTPTTPAPHQIPHSTTATTAISPPSPSPTSTTTTPPTTKTPTTPTPPPLPPPPAPIAPTTPSLPTPLRCLGPAGGRHDLFFARADLPGVRFNIHTPWTITYVARLAAALRQLNYTIVDRADVTRSTCNWRLLDDVGKAAVVRGRVSRTIGEEGETGDGGKGGTSVASRGGGNNGTAVADLYDGVGGLAGTVAEVRGVLERTYPWAEILLILVFTLWPVYVMGAMVVLAYFSACLCGRKI